MSGINFKILGEYSSLFADLTEDELKAVSEIVSIKNVDSGHIIIKEGEVGDQTYLLEDGIVDVYKQLVIVASKHEFGTKEKSLIRMSGSDRCFFGETALFKGGPRSATVKAVTMCRLIVLERKDFSVLCTQFPSIGYKVMKNIAIILSKYLSKSNEDVIKLTTALSLALSGK